MANCVSGIYKNFMQIKFSHNSILIIFLSIIWLLCPFLSVFLILLFISKQLSEKQYKYLLFLISVSFALLAYTQKSLFWDGTDITRYYYEFSPFINSDPSIIPLLLSGSILTYTFTIINILLVFTLKNVQVISLFWIGLIYYLYFLTVIKLLKKENIVLSGANIFLITSISIFGFILFTQVTETIKNAAAFAIFFYAFTCYLNNENNMKIIILCFLGIGVHSSIIMLLPLFLYKIFNSRFLFVVLLICIISCRFIDLMELSLKLIPDFGYFSSLLEKADSYTNGDGGNSSIRYIGISFVILLAGLYLWKNKVFNIENKYINIILMYLIIMYLNFNNSNAFIRWANFAQFIMIFEFVQLLKNRRKYIISIICFFVVFYVTNLQMTYGRTLSGGYCSSYMDNSMGKALFSSVYNYLEYKSYP